MDTGNIVLTNIQHKWSEGLNESIQLDTLIKAFKNAKKEKYSPSVYQHFIQSIHRRIVHNKIVHKMGISGTPNCLYCNNVETIEHVYIECENVRRFMEQYRKLG